MSRNNEGLGSYGRSTGLSLHMLPLHSPETELIQKFKSEEQSFYSGRPPDAYTNTIADRTKGGEGDATVVFVTGPSGWGKSALTGQLAVKVAEALSGIPNPELFKKHMRMREDDRPFTIENLSWVEGVKAAQVLKLISANKQFGDWDEREVRAVTDLLGTVVDILREGSRYLPRRDRAAAHVIFIDGPMTGSKNIMPREDDVFQDVVGHDRLYSLMAKYSQDPTLGMREHTFHTQVNASANEQLVRLRARVDLVRSKTRAELISWFRSCGQIVKYKDVEFLLKYLPATVAGVGAATQMAAQLSRLAQRLHVDGGIELTQKQLDGLDKELRLIEEEGLLLTDLAVHDLQSEKIEDVLKGQVFPNMRNSIGLPDEQVNPGDNPQLDEYHSYPALRKHNPIVRILRTHPELLLPRKKEETVFLPVKKREVGAKT